MTDNKLSDAPMFGNIIAADFDNDTLTLKMEPGYYAAAGRFQLQRAALSAHAASLAAPPAQVEWVMVPMVPTPEMDAAGKDALSDNGVGDLDDSDALICYAAMLAAAPDVLAAKPPANGDVDLEKVELWVANNCYDPVIEKTLFAAIAALQQKVGWQPIETAPKDGRTIILAHETSFLGFWDISQKAWCDHRKFYRDPSRWMALPPIPATGSQGESA